MMMMMMIINIFFHIRTLPKLIAIDRSHIGAGILENVLVASMSAFFSMSCFMSSGRRKFWSVYRFIVFNGVVRHSDCVSASRL